MPSRFRWVVSTLLVVLVLINYIDRSAVAYAVGPVSEALSLSPSQWGWVSGAFSIGYLLTVLVCGPLIDRYGPRRTLSASVVTWSAASVLTSFAGSFLAMFGLRAFLGIGEAPGFPATSRAASRWLAKREQAMFLSVMGGAAVCFALLIGGPLVTALLLHFGWRLMFSVLGALGFVWVVLWLIFFRDDPAEHGRVNQAELARIRSGKSDAEQHGTDRDVSILSALKNRQLWAVAIGFFAWGYTFWGIMYWLPGYLETAYNLDLASIGLFSVLPWLFGIVGALLGGLILGRMQRRDPRLYPRCVVMGLFVLLVGLCMVPVFFVPSLWVSIAFISLGVGAGFVTGGFWWVAAIETMPRQPALAAGVVDAAFALSGIIAPIAIGYLVEFTGSFVAGFAVMAAVAVVGALSLMLLARPAAAEKSA